MFVLMMCHEEIFAGRVSLMAKCQVFLSSNTPRRPAQQRYLAEVISQATGQPWGSRFETRDLQQVINNAVARPGRPRVPGKIQPPTPSTT